MTERFKPTKEDILREIEKGPLDCGWEGVQGRGGPDGKCPNNPLRYPDNYRPAVCIQCPRNNQSWKIALLDTSPVWIRLKQQGVGMDRRLSDRHHTQSSNGKIK